MDGKESCNKMALKRCTSTEMRWCIIIFLTPVLNSQGMKKLRYAIQKKYKNQAGINLTPPRPSQNSHAVRWHCTAESERRLAGNKKLIYYYYYYYYYYLSPPAQSRWQEN